MFPQAEEGFGEPGNTPYRSPDAWVGAMRTLPVSTTANRQPDSSRAERISRKIIFFIGVETPTPRARGVRGVDG